MAFSAWFLNTNHANNRRPGRGQTKNTGRRSFTPRLETLETRELLSAAAVANTVTVTNDHDSGTGSLRQAIADVSDGGTINFAKSVHEIKLTSGELAIGKNLTIQGPGEEKLEINAGDRSRVFDVAAGNVQIVALTVSHGRADKDAPALPDSGGGILNQTGANLTLRDVSVVESLAVGDNSVTAFVDGYLVPFNGYAIGGGLANFGTLSVTGGAFRHNEARGADGSAGADFTQAGYFNFPGLALGGALDNHGTATVVGTRFLDNVAHAGNHSTGTFAGTGGAGAIYNDNTLEVTGSLFSDNLALGGDDNAGDLHTGHGLGGAIASGSVTPFSGKSASLTIGQSLFDHNEARGGDDNQIALPAAAVGTIDLPGDGVGGALFVYQGSVGVEQSRFTRNLALGGAGATGDKSGDALGGGVLLLNFIGGVTATVEQSIIDHNDAIGGAGGDGADGGNAFGGGIASGSLGASFAGPGTFSLVNSRVDHDLAQGGRAGAGGAGGDGLGGGLYLDYGTAVTILGGGISGDTAKGGTANPPAAEGQSVGGGIYNNGGALIISPTTVIAHNHASTSNDDIYP